MKKVKNAEKIKKRRKIVDKEKQICYYMQAVAKRAAKPAWQKAVEKKFFHKSKKRSKKQLTNGRRICYDRQAVTEEASIQQSRTEGFEKSFEKTKKVLKNS